jgi:hypothetical protein
MPRPRSVRFLLRLAAPIAVIAIVFWAMGRPQFWHFQITGYEKADRANSPKPGVIVFTGSSSIRHWETLSDDMKPLDVSMKPAPWGNWQLMDRTNRTIAAYIRTQPRVQFIDVSAAMLDSQGKPRSELYGWDPMHMNPSGYALWTPIVKPVLMERFGTK